MFNFKKRIWRRRFGLSWLSFMFNFFMDIKIVSIFVDFIYSSLGRRCLIVKIIVFYDNIKFFCDVIFYFEKIKL